MREGLSGLESNGALNGGGSGCGEERPDSNIGPVGGEVAWEDS
jgi:hypothetical protein